MTLLERIKSLCRSKKNISITTLEQTLGYSNGSLAKAKDIPSSRVMEIADYLEVSVDYLMTGEEPQIDYLYTDENADFLIEVTRMAKDKEFVNRMRKYMELLNDSRKSVDDMIDFMYEKQIKDEN